MSWTTEDTDCFSSYDKLPDWSLTILTIPDSKARQCTILFSVLSSMKHARALFQCLGINVQKKMTRIIQYCD